MVPILTSRQFRCHIIQVKQLLVAGGEGKGLISNILRATLPHIWAMNDDNLDEFRFQLFERSSTNDLRNLPPSSAALVLHINSSAYQLFTFQATQYSNC